MMEKFDVGLLSTRRVRLIRQIEAAECGLAAIAMVATYHGLDSDLGTLRRRFQPSLRGSTLKSLMEIADQLGFAPQAVKVQLDELRKLHLPAILHWDFNHFVVIEKVARGKALIHNSEGWSRWMRFEEISDHLTGVALELRPTSDFEPRHLTNNLKLPQLWQSVTGLKRALIQTLALSIIMQAFVLASPYYMQIAIDRALPALDVDLLAVLALGFGMFALINAAATLLRSFVLLSAATALGYGITSNVARRLLRLPISWFEKRHIGDVLSRFQSIVPIRQLLTETAIGSLLDGVLTIFTLALMLFYNSLLTAIAVAAFACYALVRVVAYPAQRAAQEHAIVMAGREQSVMIETLRGIATLRLFARESQRLTFWQSRLADSINAGVSLSRIGIWQQTASALIFGIETILSVWIGVGLVINGGFSVGMLFAFMSYRLLFVERGSALVDQAILFRMVGLHLERLSDIAMSPRDPSFLEDDSHARELKGRIELRDLGFRYSPVEPWILRGINLVVAPGDHIAITGGSGGGKTTLLKIIMGLIEPVEGEVLVDGEPLRKFGYKQFHRQVGAVLQEDNLFAGSLADNITLFDETPDRERMRRVARDAAVADDIDAMPMGFETLVGDMGSTLSGGQKQRVLLARALYYDPKLLVVDEGTSNLDTDREKQVNAAIARLGITRIVVAHRLETILDASLVYSLGPSGLEEVTERIRSDNRDLIRMMNFSRPESNCPSRA